VQYGSERVVVTGGAGFIGSHLVDALLADPTTEVTVIDNFRRGRMANLVQWESDPRLRIIRADVRDLDAVSEGLREAAVVYHLAAQSTVMGAARDVEYTFNTNVVGTFNVLKAAAAAGARRVVFSSSREVYGEPVGLPVDESHPLLSINSYGASKVAGEAQCRAFARECSLETAILRLSNVYGERDFDRVIPHWIEQARADEISSSMAATKSSTSFGSATSFERCSRPVGRTSPYLRSTSRAGRVRRSRISRGGSCT